MALHGTQFRQKRIGGERLVKVTHTEYRHLHGQTVEVQICQPAACAGSSSWKSHPPRDQREAMRVVTAEMGVELGTLAISDGRGRPKGEKR